MAAIFELGQDFSKASSPQIPVYCLDDRSRQTCPFWFDANCQCGVVNF
ncbi:18586_t:CDS:2, partial [Dentiscutata erythropus]